ncbi:hypothetical protein AZA_88253 [Nitrospirillum viridazoti Y2]|nr:hypothetical protein AZA_88253 [Nitrospirillum amazonense Y2]
MTQTDGIALNRPLPAAQPRNASAADGDRLLRNGKPGRFRSRLWPFPTLDR